MCRTNLLAWRCRRTRICSWIGLQKFARLISARIGLKCTLIGGSTVESHADCFFFFFLRVQNVKNQQNPKYPRGWPYGRRCYFHLQKRTTARSQFNVERSLESTILQSWILIAIVRGACVCWPSAEAVWTPLNIGCALDNWSTKPFKMTKKADNDTRIKGRKRLRCRIAQDSQSKTGFYHKELPPCFARGERCTQISVTATRLAAF